VGPSGADGAPGTNGATGPQGFQGATGPQGPAGTCDGSCGSTGGSAGQYDMYLEVDGIPGEATDSDHKNWINVGSFSWGGSMALSTSGTGGATGKVSLRDIQFQKRIDKASPNLLKVMATGKHLENATLEVINRADGGLVLLIDVSGVMVTAVDQTKGGGDSALTETLSINFTEIHYSYVPRTSDGSAGGAVEFNFNVAENKSL